MTAINRMKSWRRWLRWLVITFVTSFGAVFMADSLSWWIRGATIFVVGLMTFIICFM